MSRSVLIARQDSVGDVLLAGPALRAVAAGDTCVSLLCGPRGRPAAELLPGVSELIVWRADWIDPEPHPLRRIHVEALVDDLAARGFEEALILTSFHQSPLPLALLLRMAGVPRIAAISEDYPGSLLDLRVSVEEDIHEVQRALAVAEACGYGLSAEDDRTLAIKRRGEIHPVAESLRPYVVVHPGASVPARAWSASRNRELVTLLTAAGQNVVVTGSAGERALTAAVCREAVDGHVADLGGVTSLGELAEVIAGAEALVVGNTGPAHLAAAVGTPVVSLYAPTVPASRWHPWRVPFEQLGRELPCAGCRARTCPVPGHPCVDAITAEEVLRALSRLAPTREEIAA
ncbi:MAG TPA: glycosyltransferase family 9 protein [Solirubrobacteraceae bacterium]|jgi:ADP-heptose:LPS heptosyltransferase|nr:glycosyltransferase family 9 protein [Solirubrobacteraceae bacterium]